MLCYVKLSDCC